MQGIDGTAVVVFNSWDFYPAFMYLRRLEYEINYRYIRHPSSCSFKLASFGIVTDQFLTEDSKDPTPARMQEPDDKYSKICVSQGLVTRDA
jgi:hypothetical protein